MISPPPPVPKSFKIPMLALGGLCHLPLEPRVSSPEARAPTIWPEAPLLPPHPVLLAARASGHPRGLRSGCEQGGGLGTRGPLKQKRSRNRILTFGKVFFPPFQHWEGLCKHKLNLGPSLWEKSLNKSSLRVKNPPLLPTVFFFF